MREAAPAAGACTILIAEDDPIVALDLELQVAGSGHRVAGPFRHGAAAVEALGAARPDIAIVDYNLIDGPADGLVTALSQARVPFAVVSVTSRLDFPEGVAPIGVFTKPFDMDRLSDLLALTLAGKGP